VPAGARRAIAALTPCLPAAAPPAATLDPPLEHPTSLAYADPPNQGKLVSQMLSPGTVRGLAAALAAHERSMDRLAAAFGARATAALEADATTRGALARARRVAAQEVSALPAEWANAVIRCCDGVCRRAPCGCSPRTCVINRRTHQSVQMMNALGHDAMSQLHLHAGSRSTRSIGALKPVAILRARGGCCGRRSSRPTAPLAASAPLRHFVAWPNW
jgi:Fe-S cluster biogenesis protein NfuA